MPEKPRIFLSRPLSIDAKYEDGLKNFVHVLYGYQFDPRTIGDTDIPTKSPLDEVIRLMEMCSGAVVLGYPRSGAAHIENSESPVIPTEWNHIEAALAYAKKLPLLVIHDRGISRGIFDRGATNCFIHEADLAAKKWAQTKVVKGAISRWIDEVREHDSKNLIAARPQNEAITSEIALKFLPEKGIYMDSVSGDYFCHSCFVDGGVRSPLAVLANEWQCNRKGCRTFYRDRSKPFPEPKVRTGSRYRVMDW